GMPSEKSLTLSSNLMTKSGLTSYFATTHSIGEFTGHENEWVTVHNQKIAEYGKEYSDDQLDYVLETMPGAIQLPVD
ncbi:3469_t:CDS:1, partial [Paraglomus brasilianum]